MHDVVETIIRNSSIAPFELLLQAAQFAKAVGRPRQYFAVELSRLCEAGLTNEYLRYLVAAEYLAHFVDDSRPDQYGRAMQETPSLTFSGQSCFALSDKGFERIFAPAICLASPPTFNPRKQRTGNVLDGSQALANCGIVSILSRDFLVPPPIK